MRVNQHFAARYDHLTKIKTLTAHGLTYLHHHQPHCGRMNDGECCRKFWVGCTKFADLNQTVG